LREQDSLFWNVLLKNDMNQ